MVRPSYVLGGRAMEIVYSDADVHRYINTAVEVDPERPVLVDKYLDRADELDVDALAGGWGGAGWVGGWVKAGSSRGNGGIWDFRKKQEFARIPRNS